MEMPSLAAGERHHASASGDTSGVLKRRPGKAQFKIRLANVPGIRREASLLVKERYSEKGYSVQELGDSPYRLTVVAYDGTEAIGTLSVGFDSPDGLLCDERYKDEIDALRASGRKICEFIKLAVVTSSTSIPTLAALFHVAFIYAYRIYPHDDVVMEVNPQHAMFYRRGLGFTQLGNETLNPRVHAPAVLLRCKLSYIDEQLKKFGGHLIKRRQEKSIYPYGFSPEEEQGIFERLSLMRESLK